MVRNSDFQPVKARKDHQCSQCGRTIIQGEEYYRNLTLSGDPIYCDTCKTAAVPPKVKYTLPKTPRFRGPIRREGDDVLIIVDDKSIDRKHYLFLTGFITAITGFLAIVLFVIVLTVPAANRDSVVIMLTMAFIALAIPVPFGLIALYYRNKIYEWILNKSTNTIIHQQTRPGFRQLKTFPLSDVNAIIFIKRRKVFYNVRHETRFKFFTAFGLTNGEKIQFWVERGVFIEFPHGNLLGEEVAEFLNVPLTAQISNNAIYLFTGFFAVLWSVTIPVIVIDDPSWIVLLSISIVATMYISLLVFAHWYGDRRERHPPPPKIYPKAGRMVGWALVTVGSGVTLFSCLGVGLTIALMPATFNFIFPRFLFMLTCGLSSFIGGIYLYNDRNLGGYLAVFSGTALLIGAVFTFAYPLMYYFEFVFILAGGLLALIVGPKK